MFLQWLKQDMKTAWQAWDNLSKTATFRIVMAVFYALITYSTFNSGPEWFPAVTYCEWLVWRIVLDLDGIYCL